MSKNRTRTKDKYRVVYNELQRMELENEFGRNEYIAIPRKQEIAQRLQLSERQIKIWFQNRRAKKRKQQKRRQGNHQQQQAPSHQPQHQPIRVSTTEIQQHTQQQQQHQQQQQPIRVSTTDINSGNSSDDLYAIQQQQQQLTTVSPQIATSPAIIASGQHQQFHQSDTPSAPPISAPALPASVSPYTAHSGYADGYHSHSHHLPALSHHLHDINHHHHQAQQQPQQQQHPHPLHHQAQHHHTHHGHNQQQQQQHHQQHHQHPHHHYAHHYGQQHYQYHHHHHHHLNQEQLQAQEAPILQPTGAEYQQYQHPAMAGQHQHGYHLPSTIDIGQPI